LNFKTALQSLIATILSAQCTDLQVNKVTPVLFKRFKTAKDFANADQTEIESIIRSTGFFKNKTSSIKKACAELVKKYNSKVPKKLDELVTLPGVGRKTANVVLGNYFGVPGVAVDTHVIRISQRLKLTNNSNPTKIEMDLQKIFLKKDWVKLSLLIQAHGRRFCVARNPKCSECPIASYCLSKKMLIQK